MSFRRRLLLLFALAVLVSVAAVASIVLILARRAFDRANNEQTAALVAQFQQEFERRGEEVGKRIQAAASTPEALRMAVAAAQSQPRYNSFLDDAQSVADLEQLNFLEFVDDRGAIISSAQWPAKFGYQEPLATSAIPAQPFLKDEETPDGHALGLFSVRTTAAGDRKLFVIGGIRLDRNFLSSLRLPAGMRVMLYANLYGGIQTFSANNLVTTTSVSEPQDLQPLVSRVQASGREESDSIRWGSGEIETVHGFPLAGASNPAMAVLLVGNSRQIYTEFRNQIRSAALLAAGVGLLLAVVLSSLAAANVTRPVEALAEAAQQVAAGDWNTNVEINAGGEIGELAAAFNRMTHDLLDQRERLVQAERVAAWREVARRLAHELKNPLFPLQLTVENLLRSRAQGEQLFDETFRESASTLLAEIANLKSIIGRFSDFSKMPQPQFQPVQLNDVIESVLKVFQAQLANNHIDCVPDLHAPSPISADTELLHRAISNLISNAIDAMPQGGTLTLRTSQSEESARIEISDTGSGLAPEESARLFTPYYTSKPHGTGLGLAIVQSIVSDHGGKISVNSEPGRGTTFIIELPQNRSEISVARSTRLGA